MCLPPLLNCSKSLFLSSTKQLFCHSFLLHQGCLLFASDFATKTTVSAAAVSSYSHLKYLLHMCTYSFFSARDLKWHTFPFLESSLKKRPLKRVLLLGAGGTLFSVLAQLGRPAAVSDRRRPAATPPGVRRQRRKRGRRAAGIAVAGGVEHAAGGDGRGGDAVEVGQAGNAPCAPLGGVGQAGTAPLRRAPAPAKLSSVTIL